MQRLWLAAAGGPQGLRRLKVGTVRRATVLGDETAKEACVGREPLLQDSG